MEPLVEMNPGNEEYGRGITFTAYECSKHPTRTGGSSGAAD
jgi:hypothetical protein